MSEEWTHNVCEKCWFTDDTIQTNEDGTFRPPARAKEAEPDVCCLCGVPTVSGIYVRRRAIRCRCEGNHEHPEEWSPYLSLPDGG